MYLQLVFFAAWAMKYIRNLQSNSLPIRSLLCWTLSLVYFTLWDAMKIVHWASKDKSEAHRGSSYGVDSLVFTGSLYIVPRHRVNIWSWQLKRFWLSSVFHLLLLLLLSFHEMCGVVCYSCELNVFQGMHYLSGCPKPLLIFHKFELFPLLFPFLCAVRFK